MTCFNNLRVCSWKLWEIVDISVVLVPVLEKGSHRVEQEEEEENENEDFLQADLEN